MAHTHPKPRRTTEGNISASPWNAIWGSMRGSKIRNTWRRPWQHSLTTRQQHPPPPPKKKNLGLACITSAKTNKWGKVLGGRESSKSSPYWMSTPKNMSPQDLHVGNIQHNPHSEGYCSLFLFLNTCSMRQQRTTTLLLLAVDVSLSWLHALIPIFETL